MGKPAVSLRDKVIALCAAALMACGFASSAFAEDEIPTSMLVSSLFDGSAAVVNEDVVLAPVGADGNASVDAIIESVIGSFTVNGLTFVTSSDGVTLVSVDSSVILSAGSEAVEVEESLGRAVDDSGDSSTALRMTEGLISIPSVVVYKGIEYPVTAIGPYAFYLSGATQVELPASIASVDDRAFRSSNVEWVDVSADNPNMTSFDGAIYSADLSRLLLIPEGRKGSVLLSCETEVVEASKFSHCSLVEAISVEEGGAAFSSWGGLLYDATGQTLLRVPAGATKITIREGCTTIAAGAMEGCAKLERINAPATVTFISPDIFESVPTISLPASMLSDDGMATQLTATVTLPMIDAGLPSINPSLVEVALPEGANVSSWERVHMVIMSDLESHNETLLAMPGISNLPEEGLPSDKLASDNVVLELSSGATYADTPLRRVYVNDYDGGYLTLTKTYNAALASDTNKSDREYTPLVNTSRCSIKLTSVNAGSASGYGEYALYPAENYAKGSLGDGYNGGRAYARAGYRFMGWSADSTATTGSSSIQNASIGGFEYYAIFLRFYTVTLDRKGGSNGTSSVEVGSGNSIATITKPTLSGWTFQGYTDDMGTNTYLFVNSSGIGTSRTITADRTLLANWTKTVNFNANGGTAGSLTSMTAAIGRPLGQKCSQVSSTNPDYPIRNLFSKGITDNADWAPTRAGYTFAGFYNTSASTGGTCYVNASGVAQSACNPVTSSMPSTLYARWTANTYAVSFDANGGTGGQSATVTATYGSSMPTISTTKPARAGYTFDGWYDTSDSTGGTQYYTAACTSARTWNKASEATLFARWTGNPITLTWNANGGSDVSPTIQTYPGDAKVIIPSIEPTRAGYVFAGWWTGAEGGDEVTNATELPTADATYYAHWSPVVSATMPLQVTARIDLLGVDEQEEAASYIESLGGEPLKVTDAEFEPLPGAEILFGADVGSVDLVGFPDTGTTPLFTFPLDTEEVESNADALSPLTMASYGTRIPIRYRFDIPDELLPTLTETTLPVCQVSYTVALVE